MEHPCRTRPRVKFDRGIMLQACKHKLTAAGAGSEYLSPPKVVRALCSFLQPHRNSQDADRSSTAVCRSEACERTERESVLPTTANLLVQFAGLACHSETLVIFRILRYAVRESSVLFVLCVFVTCFISSYVCCLPSVPGAGLVFHLSRGCPFCTLS